MLIKRREFLKVGSLAATSLTQVSKARPLMARRMRTRGVVTCASEKFLRKTPSITVLMFHACQMVNKPARKPERIVSVSEIRVSRVRERSLRCMILKVYRQFIKGGGDEPSTNLILSADRDECSAGVIGQLHIY